MNKLRERLVRIFLGELGERVDELNRGLLALEKTRVQAEQTEILGALFRTAHSLKGAAGAVQEELIEAASHRLEGIFSAIRSGEVSLDSELFELLFGMVDAIQKSGMRLRNDEALSKAPVAEAQPRLDEVTEAAAASPSQALRAPAVAAAPAARTRDADTPIRMTRAKLDALLARSSELLPVQERLGIRQDAVRSMQDTVRRWRIEWRSASKTLTGNATRLSLSEDILVPVDESRTPEGAERIRRFISRTTQGLWQLDRDLERLLAGMASDRRMLDQAVSAVDGEVQRARMRRFAETCGGLERLVRDLAKTEGKQARLVVVGGDVELDGSILDGLKDPLVHLVRNAIDHGIELPDERSSRGKPAAGLITVAAALRGNSIEVVVSDDGTGLDFEAIRKQARQRGLPEDDDRALTRCLFLPGFSTSPDVTPISGRGVGLDVVKANVEAIRGTIDLLSEAGKGTRVIMTLPLTLTRVRALLVRAGSETVAIDSASVLKLVRIDPNELRSVEGRDVMLAGETPVPVVALAELLGLRAPEPASTGQKLQIALLGAGSRRAGLAVDAFLGEQEIVIRSLGPRLIRVRNIAGATILPTGRIALVLHTADVLVAALDLPAGRMRTALPERAAATKKSILVVDDSVTTRTLEKSILEIAGYEVTAAADGEEAWRLLQEKRADLVVSDVEMPRMDGFALTETIRKTKQFRDLPIVLVTARESAAEKARGLELGADAYLVKSAFDQQKLLEAIAQLL